MIVSDKWGTFTFWQPDQFAGKPRVVLLTRRAYFSAPKPPDRGGILQYGIFKYLYKDYTLKNSHLCYYPSSIKSVIFYSYQKGVFFQTLKLFFTLPQPASVALSNVKATFPISTTSPHFISLDFFTILPFSLVVFAGE